MKPIIRSMTDIFLKMGQNEISECVKSLESIISGCKSDSDIIARYAEIERCLHNIRGLAPMIGFEKLSQVAELADEVLNDVIKNDLKFESYNFVSESIITMRLILENQISSLEQLKEKNITSHQILKLFK